MGGVVLDYEAKRILYQGIEKGRAEGRAEGRTEGRTEGRAEGIEMGIEKGRLKTLFELVRNRLLSVADAANTAGMSEADFISRMNESTASA